MTVSHMQVSHGRLVPSLVVQEIEDVLMLSILVVTAFAVVRCSRFIAAEIFSSKTAGGVKRKKKGMDSRDTINPGGCIVEVFVNILYQESYANSLSVCWLNSRLSKNV